jgi:fatty acid desaturase
MATSFESEPAIAGNDAELQHQIGKLRQTDNLMGWYYLGREYVFLAVILAAAIGFYAWLESAEHSWLWALPVTLLAITLIGAGQQRLATLTHEAAHYMLFRNRLLNEFCSEWFCMFPIFGTTHSYRVQHLGHHQYPNDPDRDPDGLQMLKSGHRFAFPMTRLGFLWHCVIKQILIPLYPIRYALVRAGYVVHQGEHTPYRMKRHQARALKLVHVLLTVTLLGALACFVWLENAVQLACASLGIWLAGLAFFACAPESWFEDYFIKSDLPIRWQKALRWTFNTMVLTSVAFLTLRTGQPWWLYYAVLWVAPLGTSFAFFMILRQIVQHGNADQERYSNTRIFNVNWLIRWAIFPIGNDYHLPHHLFPMVPHYNLHKLHALLMQTDEYRDNATIVDGYFLSVETLPRNPTVLELMTQEQQSANCNSPLL